jgi:hypothetical protein
MNEHGSAPDEDLAEWLKEAGHRTIPPTGHRSRDDDAESISSASLFGYLEGLAGRKLRSRAALVSYLAEISGDAPKVHRARARNRIVRETVLVGLLALAFLQYYFWDVHLQIASLQSIHVFAPVPPAGSRQHTSSYDELADIAPLIQLGGRDPQGTGAGALAG